jgi:hypothetical protein
MSDINPVTPTTESHPRPPACPCCGAKMNLVRVDPQGSKYINLDLWWYGCEPCGEKVSNFVARPDQ